ncbi:MAG: alpha/beta hydrolase [Spirochaetales bacterium]|nr:alpha/beta hydrolase [Spirochaetales bacterium]
MGTIHFRLSVLAAVLILASACVSSPDDSGSESDDHTLPYTPVTLFDHDGASVQAFVFGDPAARRRVLFVHGWAGSGAEFVDLATAIVASRPDVACYAIDLPGAGTSDKPADAPYDIPYYRAVVDEAVDAAMSYSLEPGDRVDDLTLVGHSLGGHICVDYLVRGAGNQKIDRLVLISPAGWPGEVGTLNEWAAKNELILGAAPHLITEETYLAGHKMMMVFSGNAYSEAAVRYTGRSLESPEAKAALSATTMNALEQDHIDGILDQISVPVMLVWGKNDYILPFSYAKRFLSRLPAETRFEAFDRCGHMPHLEYSSELSAMFSTFVGF